MFQLYIWSLLRPLFRFPFTPPVFLLFITSCFPHTVSQPISLLAFDNSQHSPFLLLFQASYYKQTLYLSLHLTRKSFSSFSTSRRFAPSSPLPSSMSKILSRVRARPTFRSGDNNVCKHPQLYVCKMTFFY